MNGVTLLTGRPHSIRTQPLSRFNAPTATAGRAPSHGPPDVHYAPGIQLAHALGWFSIGLGLAELLAARQMARLTGVSSPAVLQMYGLREIGIGIGILACDRPATWMWGRVAGDLLDLTTLGCAYVEGNDNERFASTTASAAVVGVMALDVATAVSLTAAERLEG